MSSTRSPSTGASKTTNKGKLNKDVPHPYGIKPPGNAFLEEDPRVLATRSRGLGAMRVLTDDMVLEVLSSLTSTDLSATAKVSRAMYCYSHHSDIWRDLVLRRSRGRGIQFNATWKDTYGHMYISDYKTHAPIRINGIYSDLLYRSWMSHTFDLEKHCPGILKHSDIERVDAKDLSLDAFLELYEVPNIPLIITNGLSHWKALSKWNREYIAKVSGDQLFRATSATAPLTADFTMEQYFQYASQCKEEVPLYLFERNFCANPVLKDDYDVPKYFNSDVYPGTDLFRFFGEHRRPDHKWLIAGPARSGSIFHIDPNQTNAWNVCIEGRKKWIFYPREVHPPGVISSKDGGEVTVPISTGEWLLSFWSFHIEARNHPNPKMRPLECTLLPGEIIFVPHGYWHMVVNLDDCIALTHNYVSTSNLADCLRFLRDKQDQISGVRDRPNTVLPEAMFDEIVTRLGSFLTPEEAARYVQESERPEVCLLGSEGRGDGDGDGNGEADGPLSLNHIRRNQRRGKGNNKRKWHLFEDIGSGESKSSEGGSDSYNDNNNFYCNNSNNEKSKQNLSDHNRLVGGGRNDTNGLLGDNSSSSSKTSNFCFDFNNF